MTTPRLVEVRQHLLKKNDLQARELRARFGRAGVFVVSLVSSPGSGKTAFLERTLTALVPTLPGRGAGRRPGDRERRRPSGPQRRAGETDRHRHGVPPRGRDGRTRAGRLAAGRARHPVHRERRQPGLSRLLRPRRDAAPGAAVGHRGRGQAAQVPDHLQHRRRRRRDQDATWPRPPAATSTRCAATSIASAPACRSSRCRRRAAWGWTPGCASSPAGP